MKIRKSVAISAFMLIMLLIQPIAMATSTASEEKLDWFDAKEKSTKAQEAHREAKITWAADQTDANNQAVIDTGKEVLNAALDEAQAWLLWKDQEVEENPELPDELKQTIHEDVEKNLLKIGELRKDVDEIENKLDMALVYLKIVEEYLELLTDVARNSGDMWVHIANTKADTVEEFEETLRQTAESMDDNEAIIEKLDLARTELEKAQENIDSAEAEYEEVNLPGTPMTSFSNGNNYLRIAKGNLISAHGHLNQAYNLIVEEGR